MAPSSAAILPALLTILSLPHFSSHAAAPPLPPPSPGANEFLESHNAARAAVGVGPLTWNQTLAAAAGSMARLQRDRAGCQFANLSNAQYGANQMWASGAAVPAPRAVVGSWVEEKKYYDHRSNTCAAVGGHTCGVYTQVVWRKSLRLGCAAAVCIERVKEKSSSLTICLYDPPGNYVGESPY